MGDIPPERLRAQVTALAIKRLDDGNSYIAAGCSDGVTRIWETNSGRLLRTVRAHSGPVRAVALRRQTGGNSIIVTGGDDGAVHVWDLATGELLSTPKSSGEAAILRLAVSRLDDGDPLIVAGREDGWLEMWSADSGDRRGRPWRAHSGDTVGVQFVRLGLNEELGILSVGNDGFVRVWHASTREAVDEGFQMDLGAPLGIRLSAHNSGLTLAVGYSNMIALYVNAGSWSSWRTLEWIEAVGQEAFDLVAVGPDQPVVATGDSSGEIRFWDPRTSLAKDSVSTWDLNAVSLVESGLDAAGLPVLVAATSSGGLSVFDLDEPAIRDTRFGGVSSLSARWSAPGPTYVAGSIEGGVWVWRDPAESPIVLPGSSDGGSVWSVDIDAVGGRKVVIAGSEDGRIRKWDAETHALLSQLSGHGNAVRAVSLCRIGASPVIVSGGCDFSVRLWDAASGAPIGEPLLGHQANVWAIATCQFEGRLLVASSDSNGEIRLWRANDRTLEHWGTFKQSMSVSALAFGEVSGHTVLAAGSDDGETRLWRVDQETQAADALAGPYRVGSVGVQSVSVLELDGETVVASGSVDGKVRVWRPGLLSEPLETLDCGDGAVLALAEAPASGHGALLAGGRRGGVRLWGTGAGVGERPSPAVEAPADTRALKVVDDITTDDLLGREGMAAHLDSLVFQLASHQPDRTSVTHLDGRWGSGKSTLVELMLHPERTGARPESRLVSKPVVVKYDAWRESAVAPEWWSVASAIHRGVVGSRALPARAAILVFGAMERVWRTPSIWVAGFALVLIWWGIVAFSSDSDTLRNLDALKNVVASVTVIVLLAVTLGRILFWTSPAFGRLDLKPNDSPLIEISEQVARMRRWTPRVFEPIRAKGRRNAQWLMDWGVLVVGGGGLTLIALDARAGLPVIPRVSSGWLAPSWVDGWGSFAGLIVLVFAVGVYCEWLWAVSYRPRRAILLVIDDLDRCPPERVVRLLETVHTVLRHDKEPKLFKEWRKPAPLIVLVLADGRWVRSAFEAYFKDYQSLGTPVHSLGADFIQKVFDHTVIVPSLTPRQVGDYLATISKRPGTAVSVESTGGAGVVTVSELNGEAGGPAEPDAAEVDAVVGSGDGIERVSDSELLDGGDGEGLGEKERGSGEGAEEEQGPAEEAHGPPDDARGHAEDASLLTLSEAKQELEEMPPQEMYSDRADAIIKSRGLSRQEQAVLTGLAAKRATSDEASQKYSAHLLNNHGRLMPSNPRLIKRVADAWAMLQELDRYLGNDFDDEVIARAAIVLVRFPSLASELLSAAELPEGPAGPKGTVAGDADLDPGVKTNDRPLSAVEELWRRGEVKRVVESITAEQLARCYGREAWADEPAGDAVGTGLESDAEASLGAGASQPKDPTLKESGMVPRRDSGRGRLVVKSLRVVAGLPELRV